MRSAGKVASASWIASRGSLSPVVARTLPASSSKADAVAPAACSADAIASSESDIQNRSPDWWTAGDRTNTSAPSRSSPGRALRTAEASTACGATTRSFMRRWLPGLRVLKQQRDALAAADAQRHEPELVALALHLAEALRGDQRAGRGDRVPESDRAAVRVDASLIQPEVADDRQSLRRERLVELDHADLVERAPGLLHRLANGGNRADAHDLGIAPADAPRQHTRAHRRAQRRRLLLGHQDQSR